MDDSTVSSLYTISARLVDRVPVSFHRYLYDIINWDNWLIAIKGARGVGKTTMLLQRIKNQFSNNPQQALYVSLDNLWFATNSLTDLVEYHYTHGGTHIFLDEIHKYPNWQTVIKNIADSYPDLHIVFTGSSMLKIDYSQADLSRRLRDYTLFGMSFREFLQFEGEASIKAITLQELLSEHVRHAMQITSGLKILPLFETYVKHGYYPFYKREADGFEYRLQHVVRVILNEDVPSIEDISYPTILKLQKMLMILSERVPQTPKMNELYTILETNREQGMRMMNMLQKAALLNLLSTKAKEFRHLAKPDKIYLQNTNLMNALTNRVDTGTMRETFFMSTLSPVAKLHYPDKGDFIVDNRYLFEVGGPNKHFDQIKDLPDSFLAVDNTEIGNGNRIPLWLFGFLY